MLITELLSTDGYIMYNKKLARNIGVNPSILLGYLCSEYNFYNSTDRLENDMFYCTREKIKYNTGLTETEQRTATKKLKELNIISVVLKGIPAKSFYKINEKVIKDILNTEEPKTQDIKNPNNQLLGNLTPSSKDSLELDIRNPETNNNIYNKHIKKNIDNNISTLLKNSQSTNFFKMIERTCLENDITDDKVIELIEEFFKENKIKTNGAIEANIGKIAGKSPKVIEQCIKLSNERNYKFIADPKWLETNTSNGCGNNYKKATYYNSNEDHDTDKLPKFASYEERMAYIDSLPYDDEI